MRRRHRTPSPLHRCLPVVDWLVVLVLAATLPASQVLALVGLVSVTAGLFLARLRREASAGEPAARARARL